MKVKCLKRKSTLTFCKWYKLLGENNKSYKIKNDYDIIAWYGKSYFRKEDE